MSPDKREQKPRWFTHRASFGAKQDGHMQLCSKPTGHADLSPRPSEEGSGCIVTKQ